jgi:hypothetical protein
MSGCDHGKHGVHDCRQCERDAEVARVLAEARDTLVHMFKMDEPPAVALERFKATVDRIDELLAARRGGTP